MSADTQILDWFRKKGQMTIEGNKEYYVILEFSGGKYIYRFGDTMINEDTEVKEMNEPEFLMYIKSHFVSKAKFWHKKNLRTSEEVWKYIQENPHL